MIPEYIYIAAACVASYGLGILTLLPFSRRPITPVLLNQEAEEVEDAELRHRAHTLAEACGNKGASVMKHILAVWAGRSSYPEKLKEMLDIVTATIRP